MKLRQANYYLPGHTTEITLTDETTTLKGRIKSLENEDDELLSSLMDVGYADWRKKNKLYKQLVENLNLWEMNNEEMYYFLLLLQAPQEDCYEQNHYQAYPKIDRKTWTKRWWQKLLDLDSSKSGTSTHWEQNLNFLNRKSPTFSKQFKTRLIDQKSSNIATKNIHKECIDELVDSRLACKLTAFSIKKKLEEEFEDLKNISKSTITRWLKKDLNCSYKKDDKKTWACSNPWISDKSFGSGYHPAKALLQRNRGYLYGWFFSKYQKPPVSWMVKTRT